MLRHCIAGILFSTIPIKCMSLPFKPSTSTSSSPKLNGVFQAFYFFGNTFLKAHCPVTKLLPCFRCLLLLLIGNKMCNNYLLWHKSYQKIFAMSLFLWDSIKDPGAASLGAFAIIVPSWLQGKLFLELWFRQEIQLRKWEVI